MHGFLAVFAVGQSFVRLSGLKWLFDRLVEGSCRIDDSFLVQEDLLVGVREFVREVELATVSRLFSKILFHDVIIINESFYIKLRKMM